MQTNLKNDVDQLQKNLEKDREAWERLQNENNATLDAQRLRLAEDMQQITKERDCLKDTVREIVKHAEELKKMHAEEVQRWKYEIELHDKNLLEMSNKLKEEQQYFVIKLAKLLDEQKRSDEEIIRGSKVAEERLSHQLEEERSRRAKEEMQNKARKEMVDHLETEREQLIGRLSKTEAQCRPQRCKQI